MAWLSEKRQQSALMSNTIRKEPNHATPLLLPTQTSVILSQIITADSDATQWLFEPYIYRQHHQHPRKGKTIQHRMQCF